MRSATVLRRRDRRRPRASRARLERLKTSFPVAGQEAVQMPAGDPVLGCSRGNRQLLGHDLKNGDASSGHARDCSPTPGRRAPGDRHSGPRSARASATTAGLRVTYVPRHQGHITWDIRREPRHPLSAVKPSVRLHKPCPCSNPSWGHGAGGEPDLVGAAVEATRDSEPPTWGGQSGI